MATEQSIFSEPRSEEQPAFFSTRELLERQDPATLRAFIESLYEKQYELEHLTREAQEVYESATGEEYRG